MFKNFSVGVVIYTLCNISLNHATAQTSHAQNVPAPQTYGAWTKVCSMPPGTPNIQCEIVQNVHTQNRHDITLRVTFYKLPKNQGTLMRVLFRSAWNYAPVLDLKLMIKIWED